MQNKITDEIYFKGANTKGTTTISLNNGVHFTDHTSKLANVNRGDIVEVEYTVETAQMTNIKKVKGNGK